jgi:hypothetical protein
MPPATEDPMSFAHDFNIFLMIEDEVKRRKIRLTREIAKIQKALDEKTIELNKLHRLEAATKDI